MNRHRLFMSIFMMLFMYSATAETPTVVPAGQFPNSALGQYMQPHTIYRNAAIAENMAGVYKGVVLAEAVYGELVNCPVDFSMIDVETESVSDCYAACPLTVDHMATGATVSGRLYYGNLNHCVPSACEPGYAKVDIDVGSKFAGKSADRWEARDMVSLAHTSSDGGNLLGLPEEYGVWAVDFGSEGILYGKASCRVGTGENTIVPGDGFYTTEFYGDCYCRLTGYASSVESEPVVINSLAGFTGAIVNSCTQDCAAACAREVAKANHDDNIAIMMKHASNPEKCVGGATMSVTCEAGTYLPMRATSCLVCPENSYCIGGTFTGPVSIDQGVSACASGKVSPEGSKIAGECGKIMRIGNSQDSVKLYLTSVKQTTPALAVKLDGVIYYARTTPLSSGAKPMNKDTEQSLRTKVDGIEYSIHDNTVQGE